MGRDPLAHLAAEISGRYIPPASLTFSGDHAVADIRGHILLGNAASVLASTTDRYPPLSGAGAHYNGMFGNREMRRQPSAEDVLNKGDRLAAPPWQPMRSFASRPSRARP